jgi:hypothetical protein
LLHLKLITALCVYFFTTSLSAQVLDRLSFNVGGGLSEPVLNTAKNVNYGTNLQGGVGYNFSPRLGVMVETEYDSFTITKSALSTLGVPNGFPGGHVHTRSFTLQPIWHLHPKGTWDVYATGGGGFYERSQQLTASTVANATGYNPFFGFNTPGSPASEIALSYTVVKPGVDIGAGISLKVKWRFKLYAEVKYNHVFMGSLGHMDYLPVSMGVRW